MSAAAASSSSSPWPLPPMSYEPRPAAPVRSLLPKRIDVAQLTPNNLGQLRKLNSVLFPVQYSERFYKDVLLPDAAEVCKLGLFNDVAVGTICCRLEHVSKDVVRIYIMTLGVLAPYRRLGIASALLQHVLDHVSPGKEIQIIDPETPVPKPKKDKNGKEIKAELVKKTVKVDSIYLHVQTSNDEARVFYEKFGFKVAETIESYYRRIQPASAWVLRLQ
ncbi:GNAT domain protein [Kalmanozyma brasiliensis GHG001]|uniref:N-acetyltransferase n=1 Tax=Kalmanozyma brasiliensis (strain GHG001) TaxID=1365824 RepID=V5ETG1_KALBG|nr:GNAT domain protein [Kalmanozyma brasiliensis GHG001]EST06343.1 GNAT domain protein [Kalmanozyma brasiliensis GHG001]